MKNPPLNRTYNFNLDENISYAILYKYFNSSKLQDFKTITSQCYTFC